MMEWSAMKLSKEKMEEIERRASEVLVDYGIYDGNPESLDVVCLVRSNGFSVRDASLKDSEDGFLLLRPGSVEIRGELVDGKIIALNRERSAPYKRFVVAHEFGHYALGHCQEGKTYLHRETRTGKDEVENEADYFAAALLMPREAFRRSYQKLADRGVPVKDRHIRLAAEYRVPVESARRRIEELDLAG